MTPTHPRHHEFLWVCAACDARVGCHKSTMTPKGSLAKAELRRLREDCHRLFDPYWRAAAKLRGWDKKAARTAAYEWLANQLQIDRVECHIAMFREDRAREAVCILQQLETERKLRQLRRAQGETASATES